MLQMTTCSWRKTNQSRYSTS